MATTEPSTVWILGAGFSRALGAPLFRDLFRSDHRIRAACGGSPPEGMIGVLSFYRRHAPEELGGTAREHGLFWRDPEEFLEVVESASSGSRSATELLQTDHGNVSTETLVDMGRRALAIECSHFLRGALIHTERWLPYLVWARRLTGSDTILTFNYDRIPELLDEDPDSRLKVIAPNRDPLDAIGDARMMSCAPALKMHGSVNWRVAANGQIAVAEPSDGFPEKCANGNELLLAVPGPGKTGLRKEYRVISALWTAGLEALRAANRIVFVGYRFPPSDAQARLELLRAIKYAKTAGILKSVEIVLGPDVNHPDIARMKELLGFLLPGIVAVRPLFAEDFFSLLGIA